MEPSQFVDVETARAAKGVRMVVATMVPSPWSKASSHRRRVTTSPATPPGALDAYLPAFLTPIVGFSEQDCPGIKPAMHQAFNTLRGDAGIVVPPGLIAHRSRMFEQHLPFPIRI